MRFKKATGIQVEVCVDMTQIDIALEKANRLVELLKEAKQIIKSLKKGVI